MLVGGFVILVILSMVFIAIGFLGDAMSPHGVDEEAPPTNPKLRLIAIGNLALAGLWSYAFLRTLDGESIDLVLAVIQAFGVAVTLLLAIRHFKDLRQAA